MTKEKGNSLLIIIVVVAVAALALVWFMRNGRGVPQQTAQQSAPAITSSSDFNSASKDLDSADLNQMDSQLNDISTDSSSF